MYAVIERDRDGNEKVVNKMNYFVNARDYAEALDEDTGDNGCNYLVRKINENGDLGEIVAII